MGVSKAAPLLFLLALALYWPVDTWFQSDDLVAITHGRRPGSVAADLAGPQYGLERTALFWRPLITASFAVEARLGGGDPFWSHLDNALVHALNTVLLLLLLRRLVGPEWALRAALLWALHPAQAFSVTWAVGRVDVHATLWILLTLLLHRLRRERGGRLPWELLTAAAALATKELALCLPGLVAALELGGAGGLRERWRRALLQALPHLLLVAAYLLLRKALLGVFLGGYGAPGDPALLAPSLGGWLLRLLAPVSTPLGRGWLGGAAAWILTGAGLALAAGFTVVAVRRARVQGRNALALALLFLAALVPLLPLLTKPENLTNQRDLRLFYLPLVGLAGLLAAGGWRPTLAFLALALPLHLPLRADVHAAWEFNRRAHREVLAAAADTPAGTPLFVAGLEAEKGVGLRLHLGTDRLLLPPFGRDDHPLYPWRPLTPHPGLAGWTPAGVAFPCDRLVRLDEEGRRRPDRPAATPPHTFAVHPNFPPLFGREELKSMGAEDPWQIRCGPGLYRAILFTGLGYTGAILPASPTGEVSLKSLLNRAAVLYPVRTVIDVSLRPRFQLLLQRVDENGRTLANAKRLIPVEFDRSALEILWPR